MDYIANYIGWIIENWKGILICIAIAYGFYKEGHFDGHADGWLEGFTEANDHRESELEECAQIIRDMRERLAKYESDTE